MAMTSAMQFTHPEKRLRKLYSCMSRAKKESDLCDLYDIEIQCMYSGFTVKFTVNSVIHINLAMADVDK